MIIKRTHCFAAVLVPILAVSLWSLPEIDAGLVETFSGRFGPAAIVMLVALGIVVSPIPSGVVALVAGALYGTYLGGALTVAGAVLGAAIAFLLSRHLGRARFAASRLPMADTLTRERSQTTLMMTVRVTRLVPFISFDAVSYVAGLTPLGFWRFVLATALGTTPVCLAFAAAGDTASQGAMPPAILAALSGITLLVPACVLVTKRRSPGGTA